MSNSPSFTSFFPVFFPPSVSSNRHMLLRAELEFLPTGKEFCTVTLGKPNCLARHVILKLIWEMTHILMKDMAKHLWHPTGFVFFFLLVFWISAWGHLIFLQVWLIQQVTIICSQPFTEVIIHTEGQYMQLDQWEIQSKHWVFCHTSVLY